MTGNQAEAVEKVLKGCSVVEGLTYLGRFWKVKVWFNQEVEIRTITRIIKEKQSDGTTIRIRTNYNKSNVHVFNAIRFRPDGSVLYCLTRNSRRGFYFPRLDTVVKYEPVIENPEVDEFRDYEHFAGRFDRRFITESEIQKLWAGTSAQHGGKYKPSDFRRLGPQGKQVMRQFLGLFVNVNTEGKCYFERSGHKTLEEYHNTSHRIGRDIRITHTLGRGSIYYASEFKGCGNGSYGLIANQNEFLHLEDD